MGASAMKRILFGLLLLFASVTFASAANRFAVCTVTCTWDGSSTAMWSTSTGGATGASVPGASDAVIFDAATCVGGVTCTTIVNTTVAVQSITMGACTASTTGCIVDFSANNNNVTVTAASGIITTGTGTRTLNLGNGTWTLTGNGGITWDGGTVTNYTLNANSSTILFAGSGAQLFSFGTKAVNIVTFAARSIGAGITDNSSAHTIATLNIVAPNTYYVAQNVTTTITNAMTLVGTSTNPIFFKTTTDSTVFATISTPAASTCVWCAFRNITLAGAGSLTATNSFNFQGNTGAGFSITGPAPFGAGGGCILGGWLLWRDMPEHINDNFPAWLEKTA